jgi:tetratricopeptide (TPR) repeat protein
MRQLFWTAAIVFVPLTIIAGDHADPSPGKAPLLENLGRMHHPITTTSNEAQQYFDQGLTLCFAFNHPEAIRSFEEAAKLDPNCAMAHWGIAFALGANINMPMSDDAVPRAYDALQKAQKLAAHATEKERAYIEALAKRYSEKPTKERAPYDRAFADAMRNVSRRFPDDLDAATLFAEALMDTMPWAYWTEDGKPKPETEEILIALESVLKRNPDHLGACHYYIHAVESSPNPEKGLPAAQRLRDLAPAAGHLVHMPSHIYLRLGQYHDASLCNERAVAVDEEYARKYQVKSMYTAMYLTHNIHFLSYSTSMEGRRADSLRAARKAADAITRKDIEAMPMTQWIESWPLVMLVRFGEWDQILREPKPDDDWLFVNAMWHYARGIAFVRRRNLADADKAASALNEIANGKDIEKLELPDFPGPAATRTAQAVLNAELAGLRGNVDARLAGLAEAVKLQDKLPYMEPPFWYFSIRQLHGAALVDARRFAEAEVVFREDLRRYPENGWALFGLLQSLRAQGKSDAALAVEARLREAWKHADIVLTAACF